MLADRIVVMTARPGKIKAIIPVGEPPTPARPISCWRRAFRTCATNAIRTALLDGASGTRVDAMREARDARSG